MEELKVMTVEAADGPVVKVRGQLDLAGAERVTDALLAAERTGAARVTLDVSRLSFMDSTGLQVSLDADVRAGEAGHELFVVVGDGAARRVLELADALPRLRIATVDGR